MKLPNLSFMVKVGQLRYIQSVYEAPAYRNPDVLVREFLPASQRWGCDLRARLRLGELRSQPFYYYLLARTRYYDEVFVDSICEKMGRIVNIGCGSDTRSHRFGHILKQKGARVLECDQAEAIRTKRQIAGQRWPVDHIDYLPIDLNDSAWPELDSWLGRNAAAPILVLMEGVSPYVNDDAFCRFLDFLAVGLPRGSHVAYDFKLSGATEGFGRSERTQHPFRLPETRDEVAAFHSKRGFRMEHFELSADLSQRLLPDLAAAGARMFREDGLVQVTLQ